MEDTKGRRRGFGYLEFREEGLKKKILKKNEKLF